jgi:hypothetical protein
MWIGYQDYYPMTEKNVYVLTLIGPDVLGIGPS